MIARAPRRVGGRHDFAHMAGIVDLAMETIAAGTRFIDKVLQLAAPAAELL